MEPEDTIDYNIRKTWYNITKLYNQLFLELTFNNLADKPSKKSSIAPKKIKVPAKYKLLFKEKTIATNPQNKFPRVIRFGIFLLIESINLQ